MATPPKGQLKKIDNIRAYWANEAQEFTPWLAEKINILSQTISMELEVQAQEQEVGPFRADILCKDASTGNWVLIENQLERTDHNHLGQLLTYAAGLDVVSIIWIAQKFTEEHRAALDWLNEITDDRFNFFGMEIELWQIGDSDVAPKFNLVCKPNNWSKTVKTGAMQVSEMSETRQKRIAFWTAFKELLDKTSFIKAQKPLPDNWMVHTIGRTGVHLESIISTWDSEKESYTGEIRAQLVLDGNDSKKYFELLKQKGDEIETKMGERLTWYNPTDAKVCRIYVRKETNFLNSELWGEQHQWLKEKIEKLHKVFVPIIQKIGPKDFENLLKTSPGDEQ